MAITQVLWHGSEDEQSDLLKAVEHNCGCKYDVAGALEGNRCPAHQMMLTDQRAMDGLVFMRRKADCLIRGEESC